MSPPTEAAIADADVPEQPIEDARLMGHAYDGIREYDNPLPGWWSAIFIGSIVFAVFYGLYYHVLDWGQSPEQRYAAALADYDSKKERRERAEAANVSEQTLARGSQDPKVITHGELLFKAKCASCHADDGRGLIGPNLTDDRQIHGSTRMDLYKSIARGVPGTAMAAFSEVISQPDVLAITAFVAAMRGRNLPGKEPQGAKVERWR